MSDKLKEYRVKKALIAPGDAMGFLLATEKETVHIWTVEPTARAESTSWKIRIFGRPDPNSTRHGVSFEGWGNMYYIIQVLRTRGISPLFEDKHLQLMVQEMEEEDK